MSFIPIAILAVMAVFQFALWIGYIIQFYEERNNLNKFETICVHDVSTSENLDIQGFWIRDKSDADNSLLIRDFSFIDEKSLFYLFS